MKVCKIYFKYLKLCLNVSSRLSPAKNSLRTARRKSQDPSWLTVLTSVFSIIFTAFVERKT